MAAVIEPPNRTPAPSPVEAAREALSRGERVERMTLCLEFRLHSIGLRRSIAASEVVNDGTDTTMLRVSKDIIDMKETKAIRRHDANFKAWLATRSVPSSIMRSPMYLIPLDFFDSVDAEIVTFSERRAELVREFLDRYDELIEDARGRLGTHFNEADYPPAGAVFEAYSVETQWLSFDVPAALKKLNLEKYRREKQKIEAKWNSAADEIQEALRVAYAELVAAMTEKLGADEDGKPKVFKDSITAKINDFLNTFEARNLTDDAELSRLTRQARELLRGVKPQDLRDSKDLREKVQAGLEQIKGQMAGMVVVKTRKFSLDKDV